MASAGGAETSVNFLYVIVFLFIALRIRRIISGTRISKVRSVVYSIWYVVFAGLLVAGSFLDGVPIYYAAIDTAIWILAAFGAYRAINSRLTFWRGPDGAIYAKGGIVIYMIYILGLVIRLAIDFIFVPSALSFSFSAVSLGSTATSAEIATDALLAFGSGLLTGRNARLYTRYVGIERDIEVPVGSPQ